MKNQRIIIIGADFKWEEEQLLEQAKCKNKNSEFILLDDLEVEIGTQTKFLKNKKDIFDSFLGDELFIIRRSRGNFEKLISLVEILQKRGFIFTDSFRSISTNLNKEIFMATIESTILPHPPKSFFIEPKKNICRNLQFPVVSKPVLGRHGQDVIIHKNQDSLQKTINNSNKILIVQNFLKIESEFRVFVIGKKSLGIIKKIPQKGSNIANYAQGAQFIKSDIPEKFIKESVKLCQTQKIDIGGVDIARTEDDKYFLLEINRCPEFKAFSKATNINVSSEIIKFVQQK